MAVVAYRGASAAATERPFVTDLFVRVMGLMVIMVTLLIVGQALSSG